MDNRIDISKFKDFSDCILTPLILDGVTNKIAVKDENIRYILKFGKESVKDNTYFKDYISEFISCKIAKQLGYSVQEVQLGYYNNKECCALTMFDLPLHSFKSLGASSLDSDVLYKRDIRYNLDWLLELKMTSKKFAITQEIYDKWVLDVFFLDMFVGNYDRHENNWGFVRVNGLYNLAPLYDMGASLFSRQMDEVSNWTDGQIRDAVVSHSRSAILYKGKKKNYFELLDLYNDNDDIQKQLQAFIVKVKSDINSFNKIYDEVIAYNSEYKEYVTFVDKMLRLKLSMLERRFLK